MSDKPVTQKKDKSELQKFKIFYEHVPDERPVTPARTPKEPSA